MNWASKLTIHYIEYYQKNGGGEKLFNVDCNFTPTCSEYAKESIHRFGLCQGFILAIKRVIRCNNRNLINKISDPPPNLFSLKKREG